MWNVRFARPGVNPGTVSRDTWPAYRMPRVVTSAASTRAEKDRS